MAKGVKFGRKPKLTAHQIAEATVGWEGVERYREELQREARDHIRAPGYWCPKSRRRQAIESARRMAHPAGLTTKERKALFNGF
jgi:hypothetical protein